MRSSLARRSLCSAGAGCARRGRRRARSARRARGCSTTSASSRRRSRAAEEARGSLRRRADSADLIAARAYLERFRASGESDDLTNARERLRRIDPQRVWPLRERVEFIVGLGETLYFEESLGAAADVFESVLVGRTTCMPERARARARLVGERARSRRAAAVRVRTAERLSADSRPHGGRARRRSGERGRVVLAGGRGARPGRSAGGVGRGAGRLGAGAARAETAAQPLRADLDQSGAARDRSRARAGARRSRRTTLRLRMGAVQGALGESRRSQIAQFTQIARADLQLRRRSSSSRPSSSRRSRHRRSAAR